MAASVDIAIKICFGFSSILLILCYVYKLLLGEVVWTIAPRKLPPG